MPFEQSDESKAVEELMEVKALLDNLLLDTEKIIDSFNENGVLDHENDRMRGEVTRHLVFALTAANMRSFEDVNKHINAAIQRLHSQEILDLKDDKPRTDGLIAISKIREKFIRMSERIRSLIGQIEYKRKGQHG